MPVSLKISVVMLTAAVSAAGGQMIGESIPAALGQFKHVVALLHNDEIFCSGALISDQHVLTAAHCFDEHAASDISIAAGMVNREVIPLEFRSGKIKYVHKDYKTVPARPTFDVGILLMDYPVVFDENIGKISLPNEDVSRGCTFCNITGWSTRRRPGQSGASQMLAWSTATIMNDEDCHNFHIKFQPDSEFCAVDMEEESRPSKGDSGGSLVCDQHAVGVLSGGPPDFEAPLVYTNVWHYRDFIKNVLEQEASHSCKL